ncbi:uncharacterized protein LOC134335274 [Trichomycterus rosablanca]|uniref:uncharacterized protein LOC134335274 n=1 Tax=Trichomycterus rosablanca TaxID=2290929 RepID=UPI002F351AC3
MCFSALVKVVIFLTFFPHRSSAGTHSLQVFFNRAREINFPEFTAVGLVDEEEILYYDSTVRKLMPRAEWMKKVDAEIPDFWPRYTQITQGFEETFKVRLATLMELFNQTKGVHTWQSMFSCELVIDAIRGYEQHGYDGENFRRVRVSTLHTPSTLIHQHQLRRMVVFSTSLVSFTVMSQFVMLSILCAVGLFVETFGSLTLEAEPGERVTMWCQHELNRAANIYWFKQNSSSLPVLVGCRLFLSSAPSTECHFLSEKEGIIMSLNGRNSSLTISAVNFSDSGLYYCVFILRDQMMFVNETYLQVKEKNETNLKKAERKRDFSSVFFMVIVLIVVAIVILLSFLIIIQKFRKSHTGAGNDSHMPKKKNRDSLSDAALHVDYSCVVYQRIQFLPVNHPLTNAGPCS